MTENSAPAEKKVLSASLGDLMIAEFKADSHKIRASIGLLTANIPDSLYFGFYLRY